MVRQRNYLLSAITALALVIGLAPVGGTADAAARTFADISVRRDGQGYALISEAGEVYAYNVQYAGNPVGFTGKIVAISVTDDGLGYVAISSAGQVYAYGKAVYRGNPAGFGGSIVDVSVTADGLGYVAISSRGQVYAYGTAVYRGNPTGFGGDISSVSVTPDGQGYVAMSTGGQVYAYNVVYRGNPTGFTGPMKSISVTAGGQGYIAMSSIGQMYAYNVAYRGNPTGYTGTMVGVSVTSDGQGYGAVSSSGQVYAYNIQWRGNGDPGQVDGSGGVVAVQCSNGGTTTVAAEIADAIRRLYADARAAGLTGSCGWGYRTRAQQVELRRQHCAADPNNPTYYELYEKPSSQCNPPTARPGTSQHEVGLAIDFTYNGQSIGASSSLYAWLHQNASRYGLKNLPSETWHWSTTGR